MPPVYTFAAFSGTGKTTYLEKLVPLLRARGLRVAVIKHDVHGVVLDTEGKDSWRFARAGADGTAIASPQQTAVFFPRPMGLEELLMQFPQADIVLTEGFKHGPYPKIALFRKDSGNGLPLPLEACFAVVTDEPEKAAGGPPVFPLDDPAPFAEFLIEDIRKNGRVMESSGTGGNRYAHYD